MSGRLERSRSNRVIGGVCGGIAEYLDVDATVVRVVMLVLAIPFGIGFLIYFLLLFLMPKPGEPSPFVRPTTSIDPTVSDPATASGALASPLDTAEVERRRYGLGLLLVVLGIVFLLGNLGIFRFVEWRIIWPLVLIATGLFFISRRVRR